MTFTFGSLFSGIGGIDLGLERAGMTCSFQCEIEDYPNRVLEKHWPDTLRIKDVHDVSEETVPTVDLLAGGFPCQPFSVAGKKRGTEDSRNLWPEYLRIIKALRPRWILGENVRGIIKHYIDDIISDLEGEGYTVWVFLLPAVAFGAPHRRERVFIVAHSFGLRRGGWNYDHDQRQGRSLQAERSGSKSKLQLVAYGEGERVERDGATREQEPKTYGQTSLPVCSGTGGGAGHWETEPRVGRLANGVPHRVDRLRALGNAVVPQVAEFVGRVIMEADKEWYS